MATKDARVEMRLSHHDRTQIERAAERLDENVSDFTRSAALERASRILGRSDQTLMDAQQFDALVTSLDVADDAPGLADALSRPRRFRRR